MPAHHATIKNAAKFGIILTGDADSATAKHAQTGVTIEAVDGKVAVAVCRIAARLKAEYPMFEIDFDEEAMTATITAGEEFEHEVSLEEPVDVDGIIADLLEAAQDAEIDLNGEDDEDEPAGNVVPEKYKIEYAARGNRDHCGDWLAQLLDGKFRESTPEQDDVFSPSQFLDFLRDNGVELKGKWVDLPNSGQHGWAGRFRMNGRQKLEPAVAQNGVVKLEGNTIKVPADELARLRAKHPPIEPKAEKAPKPEKTEAKPSRARKAK